MFKTISQKNENFLLFLIVLCCIFVLSGCAQSDLIVKPVEVKIPVAVKCATEKPELEKVSCYSEKQTILSAVKCMLYEREIKKAYELELEKALASCK